MTTAIKTLEEMIEENRDRIARIDGATYYNEVYIAGPAAETISTDEEAIEFDETLAKLHEQKKTYQIDHGNLVFRTNALKVYATKLKKDQFGHDDDPLLAALNGAGFKRTNEFHSNKITTSNMITLTSNGQVKDKDGHVVKSVVNGYTV